MEKKEVHIVDVAPRDGLQNEKKIIPTYAKIRFVEMLVDAGIDELEVTSFVSTKTIPQLADAEEVFKKIKKKEGIIYSCLVPTVKGLERALSVGVKKVVFFIGASETFNLKNLNSTIEDSLKNFKKMKEICDENKITIKASISTCFECPFTGRVMPSQVIKIIDRLAEMDITEFVICDTVGVATPPEVEKLIWEIQKNYDLKNFSLHMHDTYDLAVACVYKAFEMGIRRFETSAGGLGGCPNAPGARGNLATEVLYHLFERMGVHTRINKKKFYEAIDFISNYLPDRKINVFKEIEVCKT